MRTCVCLQKKLRNVIDLIIKYGGQVEHISWQQINILGLEPLFGSDVLAKQRSVVRRSYVKCTKRMGRKWTVDGHCACNQWNVIGSSFDVAKNINPSTSYPGSYLHSGAGRCSRYEFAWLGLGYSKPQNYYSGCCGSARFRLRFFLCRNT